MPPPLSGSAPVGIRRAGRGVLAVSLMLLPAAVAALSAAPQASVTAPVVVVAEYDGIIHPIAHEFFDDVLSRAEERSATAAVIVLRTPGGLLESTRAIVSRMVASTVPVAVFVAPGGARAASAGFLILLAADVAAMAPGTHIGAAHPVAAGGQPAEGGAVLEKAAEDTAAYARALAEVRGRNATLAAEAVLESRAFTEREAIEASPPLVDFVAEDLDGLLGRLDGRRLTRTEVQAVEMDTTGARVERVEMTRRQQFLSAIAHPQIAYLLLTFGMLGIVVELWNPGAVLPGVIGGVCLLLGFFAFQVLPVSTAGVILILFGIGLLATEVFTPSFGVLGIGGAVALFFGSIMITRTVPGVEVSLTVLTPVVAALAAIVFFLGRLGVKAHRTRPVTGAEALIGSRGVTETPVGAAAVGQVRTHGELWRASSRTNIPAGRPVRVTALDGLTLEVEPLDTVDHQGERP